MGICGSASLPGNGTKVREASVSFKVPTTVCSTEINIKLFLSYANKFRGDQVKEIAEHLRIEGYGHCLSPNSDKLLLTIPSHLSKAISEANLVIIFVSSEYQKIASCKSEATLASELKKRILIVLFERNFTISPWLQEIIDAANGCVAFTDGIDLATFFQQRLLENVTRILKTSQGNSEKEYIEIIKKPQLINVPSFPDDRYYKRRDGTDDRVFEAICETCLNAEKGFKLLTGDDGIGKTTLIAHVLHDKPNRQKLGRDLAIEVVIWTNCYDWLEIVESNEIHEAEKALTKKITMAAKYADEASSYDTINDVISHFQTQERKILYIFDDVMDVKLLHFFAKCHLNDNSNKAAMMSPCCVITNRDSPISSLLTEAQLAFSKFEIPSFAAEEIAAMLGTTFGLNGKLGEDKILKLANDSICCGLPLIASLLSCQFSLSNDYDNLYQVLMCSLAAIGKLDVSNENRPVKTVDHLVDFILNQLSDLEQKRFHALLIFDPILPIFSNDISLIWGFDAASRDEESTGRILQFYQQRCLLRVNHTNTGVDEYSVHKMIHYSARKHAFYIYFNRPASSDEESLLHQLCYSVVTGLAWESSRNGQAREMVMFEAVRQRRGNFVRQIVSKISAENLALLCLQTSLREDDNSYGKAFLYFLYIFDKWPDNVKYPPGHILEKYGRNQSYLLIGAILSKIKSHPKNTLLLKQLTTIATADIFPEKTGHNEASWFLLHLFDDEKNESQYWDRRPLVNILYSWKPYYEETKWKQGIVSKSDIYLAAAQGNVEDLKRFSAQEVVPVEKLREVFHIAARCNGVKVARFLFRKNPNLVTLPDNRGQTALHFACRGGHMEIVRFLIEKGGVALIRMKDKAGLTALFLAARGGYLDVVQYLTEKDQGLIADVSNEGRTVLHDAAENGHLEVAHFFVEKCFSLLLIADENGSTALHFAVRNGQAEMARYLIDRERRLIAKANKEGRLPLHYAAEDGQFELVRRLIEMESTIITTTDEDKWTALHCAAANGHVAVVRYLVAKERTLLLKTDSDGWTALHCAARSGHAETVHYLIEQDIGNIIVSKLNSYGETALHFAAVSGQMEVVRLLTKKTDPVFISLVDEDGWTALHYAAANGHIEIVRFLIEKDGSLVASKAVNSDSTPLQVAAESGHNEIVACLFESFPKLITTIDNNELTALHYAARGGHLDAVRCVFDKEPDLVTKVDRCGRTALHYACGYGHVDAANYLLEKQPSLIMMTDTDGRTAFHFAAANGHLNAVRFLFEKEPALISLPNKTGLTALNFATENGHIDVIAFLIEKDPNNFTIAIADQNGRRRSDGFVTLNGLVRPVEKKRSSLFQQRQQESIPEATNEDSFISK